MLIGLSIAAWYLLEIGLLARDRIRGKGSVTRDRGTRVLNIVAIVAAISLASMAVRLAPTLHTPAPAHAATAGLIVLWLGLGIRIWAVLSLGAAFRTTVEVATNQPLVTAGPYRWVRHPSYSGLLLIMVGFGLVLGNWLALGICVLFPGLALVRRIQVEEAELSRVLGDHYRSYQTQTKRLIPLVW